MYAFSPLARQFERARTEFQTCLTIDKFAFHFCIEFQIEYLFNEILFADGDICN